MSFGVPSVKLEQIKQTSRNSMIFSGCSNMDSIIANGNSVTTFPINFCDPEDIFPIILRADNFI